MSRNTEEKLRVEFKGQIYEVNARKFNFIQRLENAIACTISGDTVAGGVVEVDGKERSRGYYTVDDDAKYDLLLTHWRAFEEYVKADMMKFQGNAPAANRSAAKN